MQQKEKVKNYVYSVRVTKEQKDAIKRRDILKSFANKIIREYLQTTKDIYEIQKIIEMEEKIIKVIRQYKIFETKFKIGDRVILKKAEHSDVIYSVKNIFLNENYEQIYLLESMFGESNHKESDIFGKIKVI